MAKLQFPKLNLKKVVKSRIDAAGHLALPGDAVLIERGCPRWLLLCCPCGCGDEMPINLDPRAGPAWRFYKNDVGGATVYPSIWRDTDCGSHFIVWRGRIFLFGDYDNESWWEAYNNELDSDLINAVTEQLRADSSTHYADLADSLSVVPWDVLDICRNLVRKGIAQEGIGKQRGTFRLKMH